MPYNIGIDARKLGQPGIGHYIRRLVSGLAEIDEDNLYSLFVGSLYDGEFEDLPENFVCVSESSPVYSFRERVALSWRQLRRRLDIYHATHYILPLLLPRRTVTTVHDVLHLLYPDFMPGRLSMYVAPTQIRRTLARSNHIIAESQNTRADLVDYFDLRPGKISQIYPGVDMAFTPEAAPDDEGIRQALGLDKPYVLFRGDSRRHKNEEITLRAFAAATASGATDLELVCLGEHEASGERFAQFARALDLEGRFRWIDAPPAEHIPSLLRGAKLFLYPTLYEGFPMPVIESMACGLPVITANNATLREVAEGSAKLVDASSVASLAGAIGWCLNDGQLTANLAADGLKRAEVFRWRRVALQTLEVYESVLADGDGDAKVTQEVEA